MPCKTLIMLAMLGLTGCGGGSSNGAPPSNPPSEPAPAPAPTPTPASYTVATSASGLGSISPTLASVVSGNTAVFTLTPNNGYQIASVSGCSGRLSGTTYTTAAVTAACTVTATFSATSSSGGGGSWSQSVQSSTFAADNGFDFAETFDGLRDWGPDLSSPGNVGEESGDAALLPRLANGAPSAWTFYSKWGVSTDPTPWIGAYGDNRVWRGTKSASIDIGGGKGPSRLGLFAANAYKGNLYYFYMVNIPKNEFPTYVPSPNTNPASYVDGNPYTWYGSWKFMTFNYGCGSISCWDHPAPNSGYSPVAHMINHIKSFNYDTYSTLGLRGVTPGLYLNQETPTHENNIYAISEEGKSPLNSKLGNWFGVEFQLTQNANGTVTRNIWVYDRYGNAVQQMINQSWNVPGYNSNLGWDFFFHGGNNSGTYEWGPTMESVYYIDDVIIDDERIGPRYFRAIGVTR